ncbi:MAG: dTDP-4-dehydrorhamnose 3,5-epimerase family protein [Thermoplasmataceae archaeon]
MKIEELELEGAMLIEKDMSRDERGMFFKPYSREEFASVGVDMRVEEVFYSVSRKNVIRGMHFQCPPFSQGKLVSVVRGEITDVLLDLRNDSKLYGKHITVALSENYRKMLFIPRGIAHGFLSKTENTVVLYMVDSPYSPTDEDGVRYDSFGYNWEAEKPILSSRDLGFNKFDRFESPF